ncbi:unnamed protein product [Linum tenue]|uniref:Uncharacterized protein n=1 Tax=Linum tenue TaxID=586396 RepID=A0AAV0QFY9_9ROSI|nr:unnamed protein product [Linum tenue]
MEDQVAAAGDVGTASTNERVCYVHCNFCNTVLAVSVPSSSMYTMVTVRCGHCANLLSVNMGSFMAAPPPPSPTPTPSLYPNNNNNSFLPNSQPNAAAATEASLPHQSSLEAEKEQLGFEEGLGNTNVNNNSSSKDCGGSTSGSSSSSKYSSGSSSNISNNSGKQQQVMVVVSPPLPPPSPSLEYSWVDNHLHEPPRLPPIRPPEKRQRVPSAYNRFIKEEIQRIKASNPEISHREAFSTAAKNWAHFPHIHFGLKLEGNKNKHAKLGDHHHHHHHHFHHHQNQQPYGGSSATDDNIINDHNIGTLVLNHHKKTPNNNNSSNDNGFYHELNGSL